MMKPFDLEHIGGFDLSFATRLSQRLPEIDVHDVE